MIRERIGDFSFDRHSRNSMVHLERGKLVCFDVRRVASDFC